jgi:F0F1-type ATP synthase assembly protein I
MKQAIYSIIVLALSIIVWLHWGGLSNDMGTFIIMLADAFILTVIADNTRKKSEKNVKD